MAASETSMEILPASKIFHYQVRNENMSKIYLCSKIYMFLSDISDEHKQPPGCSVKRRCS